jgi:hypothetical protein
MDRFYDKVIPEPNSGCHLWLGSVDSSGYAVFWWKGQNRPAYRVACELVGRDVKFGCHKCHNPLCVNDEHIVDGNPKINSDMEGSVKLSATACKSHASRQLKRELPMYVTKSGGRLRVRVGKVSLGFVDTVEQAESILRNYHGK